VRRRKSLEGGDLGSDQLGTVAFENCHRPLPALHRSGDVAAQLRQQDAKPLLVDRVLEAAARQFVEQRASSGERAGLDQRLRIVVASDHVRDKGEPRLVVEAVPIGFLKLAFDARLPKLSNDNVVDDVW
jgi:hypothetical protein